MLSQSNKQLAAIQKSRVYFLNSSINKASARIQNQKNFYTQHSSIAIQQITDFRVNCYTRYSTISSLYGDTSSVTKGRFSSSTKYFVTVGLSGSGIIWDINNQIKKSEPQKSVQQQQFDDFCKQLTALPISNQNDKIHDVALHPKIGEIPQYAPNIITSTSQGNISFWTFNPQLQQQKSITLHAHENRVNRVLFQSSGSYFFTSSYDKSWSLWDLTKMSRVYSQKGHQKQIHASCLHPDESLFFTGDLGGSGMIWDLRTNKGIMEVQDTSGILCCDFNPNGNQIAFGGKSNTITVKDLRQRKNLKSIPAHLKLISDLKYEREGTVLVSSSHDNSIKMWHGLHYGPVKNQREDLQLLSKVSSLDISGDLLSGTTIDRKFTIWKRESQFMKTQVN